VPIYSAFYTKTKSIYLEPKVKQKILVNYLPLQFIKHSGLILLSNEKIGEFLYYLDGAVSLPEPTKPHVDENSLDLARIKLIKSNS
jgi:hypothetical protein